jgi:heme exporter protein A
MRVTASDLGVRLGGRVIFEGLAFDWRPPGVVAVTGRNGAGKTTLLRVVAGLLRPGRGRLGWEDGGRALSPVEARGGLGFVSPEIGLYEDLSPLENLAFFAAARGLDWDEAAGLRWMDRLGLAGRGHDRLGGYSSGMKQRVKLAFAFQADPTLVLLDEPGSNLDRSGKDTLVGLVREAAREALVVVATNDPEEASWADSEFALPS